MWAKSHFGFMKDPLPFNVLLFFKTLTNMSVALHGILGWWKGHRDELQKITGWGF